MTDEEYSETHANLMTYYMAYPTGAPPFVAIADGIDGVIREIRTRTTE